MTKREIDVLTAYIDVLTAYEELQRLEPIFHTKAFGLTSADAARMMADDYWEIGASGRRYDRSFILEQLQKNPPVDADTAEWVVSDFGLRSLADNTFLITYWLRQKDRVTRRATIWWFTESGWKVLYHQGTLVQGEA